MTVQYPPESDNDRTIRMFIVVSIIFVTLTLLLIAGISIVSKVISPEPTDLGPYTIANRPVPKVSNTDTVLPPKVGSFTRGAATQTNNQPIWSGTYNSGSDKITIQAISAITVAAAQQRVRNLYGGQGPNFTDPMFFQATLANGVRLAWSHTFWYFDVTASSQNALDQFMRAFPY